jgi:hypothetical protein
LLGVGHRADNPTPTKNIVTKSEEVKTGLICQGDIKKVALNGDEWAQLLKKARAHQGLSGQ